MLGFVASILGTPVSLQSVVVPFLWPLHNTSRKLRAEALNKPTKILELPRVRMGVSVQEQPWHDCSALAGADTLCSAIPRLRVCSHIECRGREPPAASPSLGDGQDPRGLLRRLRRNEVQECV